jgi:hypothetical protein
VLNSRIINIDISEKKTKKGNRGTRQTTQRGDENTGTPNKKKEPITKKKRDREIKRE